MSEIRQATPGQPTTIEAPEATTRAHQRHPRGLTRSLVAFKWASYDTPFERALRCALPWYVRTYPGLSRGALEIFGNRVTRQAIDHWRAGNREPPEWAVDMLCDHLRSRAAAMQSLADEIRAMADVSERKPYPLMRGRGAVAAR